MFGQSGFGEVGFGEVHADLGVPIIPEVTLPTTTLVFVVEIDVIQPQTE